VNDYLALLVTLLAATAGFEPTTLRCFDSTNAPPHPTYYAVW